MRKTHTITLVNETMFFNKIIIKGITMKFTIEDTSLYFGSLALTEVYTFLEAMRDMPDMESVCGLFPGEVELHECGEYHFPIKSNYQDTVGAVKVIVIDREVPHITFLQY